MQFIIEHGPALSLAVLLLISEILPFNDKVKANGIYQALVNVLTKEAKPKAEEIAKK